MARATAPMDGWEWIAACPKCAALMTALVAAMVVLAADACVHRAGRLTTAACRATSVLAPRVAITTASARVVRACATRASGAPSASSCCARTTATIEAIARRPGDACATAVGAERAARSAAAARASCGRMGAGTCALDMGRAMSTVCANATLGGRDSAARRERVGILTWRDLDSAPRPDSTVYLSTLTTFSNHLQRIYSIVPSVVLTFTDTHGSNSAVAPVVASVVLTFTLGQSSQGLHYEQRAECWCRAG